MRPVRRRSMAVAISILLLAACANTPGDVGPEDEPTATASEGLVPVADDDGDLVGWVDQQQLNEASQAQAEGRTYEPVPVVDEEGHLVGHFEPGPEGGFRPADG